MYRAAKFGDLEEVKRLHNLGGETHSELAMVWAAENGHLHVVKWLHTRIPSDASTYAIVEAASKGHLETVKWLYDNRRGCTKVAIDCADFYDRLEVVKWLQDTIKRVYYKAWMGFRGKKILWNLRSKGKFYVNQAIRARPPRGVDFVRDLEQASTLFT